MLSNTQIINNMSACRDPNEYGTFLFQMAVSIAHEIGHLLTGFLSGTARPPTPPTAQAPSPIMSRTVGEAGSYWEYMALGGIVEFYADPRDPNNPNQAGIAYVFEDLKSNAPGKIVSRRLVQAFKDGGKKWSELYMKST